MSIVRWNEMTARNVYDLQRALFNIHPLKTHFGDKIIKLLDVRVYKDNLDVTCTHEKVPGNAILALRLFIDINCL